ncbi:hypothetical protein FA15DRAFT_627956, partial [Coprinopsis marcescibilis]
MLTWPWIFFGVVYDKKGVKMKNSLASVVNRHPSSTAFFVALVGNFICLVVDVFFSLAVIRFAQEWVAEKEKVSVFHVSLFGAFRHQSFPWTMTDLKALLRKNKWLPVVLVCVCILSFQFVPSGITSLLLPVQFDRVEPLVGNELDFSSTVPACTEWLDRYQYFGNACDWRDFRGTRYTSCLGQNQLLDVLAAGRGSILSLLSNNSESLNLSQLGARDGLRILGPLRGILPIGPNGAPAFDTLQPSAFTNPDISAAMLSYNYTLDYQGLASNISCRFDTESPVVSGATNQDTNYVLQYNGTCPEGTDFMNQRRVVTFVVPNSNNSLVYWACKATPDQTPLPSYNLYLRGRVNYAETIGRITCSVNPVQPAIYPMSYQSTSHLFSTKERVSAASSEHTGLIENALVALSGIIYESQNFQSNLVAESVFTFGIKSFNLPDRGLHEEYLPLWEAMLGGMLDYGVAYSRLLYSTEEDKPETCLREVTGEVSYKIVGWFAELSHIGFLMPMTLLNLTTVILILLAIVTTKENVPSQLNPADPRILLHADQPEPTDGDRGTPWDHTVTF